MSRHSSGDGIEGVPQDDKAVVHFWHLFGSIPECRRALTSSARDSPYRNAPLLESRVRSLARVFDTETSGLDVPRVLTKEPTLLLWEANEVVRRVVELKRVAPELGGRALSSCPGLLLCDPEDVAAARQEMEFARGAEKAREKGERRREQGGGAPATLYGEPLMSQKTPASSARRTCAV